MITVTPITYRIEGISAGTLGKLKALLRFVEHEPGDDLCDLIDAIGDKAPPEFAARFTNGTGEEMKRHWISIKLELL